MSEVIHALLERENVSFGPEDVAKLIAGFESALAKLGLKDRNNLRAMPRGPICHETFMKLFGMLRGFRRLFV